MTENTDHLVDISTQVRQIINRRNILIRSFDLLDERVRTAFAEERRKAILVIRNHYFEVQLSPCRDGYLDVFDHNLCRLVQKENRVLVVLPAEEQRYVIQSVVESVFVDRFRLRAQDPRRHRRVKISGLVSLRIWRVPDVLTFMVEKAKLMVIRKALWDEAGAQGSAGVEMAETTGRSLQVQDTICDHATGSLSAYHGHLLALPAFNGTLADISPGGMLTLVDGDLSQSLKDRLLYVDVAVDGKDGSRLVAQLFAMVRREEKSEQNARLHLMFLEQLPEKTEKILAMAEAGI